MKKRIISLSVDDSIYAEFVDMCQKRGWIISKQIENYMKEFLSKEN